ncbi:DUF4124 domain-containing protein [Hydrogenophaga sp. 5NK40-0174]|uniref:DUF4124 domain-containing protein n=1 Tax=Hydrogenophaga sp. 5NK40-0174 TaxID=3127649 RepID=UPI0031089688
MLSTSFWEHRLRGLPLTGLMAAWLVVPAADAWAQKSTLNGGIYTCVDDSGRRLTSDRPIRACLDREQKVLGSNGAVIRVVPPSYTGAERDAIKAEKRALREERARLEEEKRQNRALLSRYPNKALHDKARSDALVQIDEVIGAVVKRGTDLEGEHKEIKTELEFYQGDATKAPPWLQRKLEDNLQQQKIQQQFMMDQVAEKSRINVRFDEELARLRKLWIQYGYKNAESTVAQPEKNGAGTASAN